MVSHPNTNPAEQGLTSVNSGITKLSDCSESTLKHVLKRSCEGTRKLSTCQPRSQRFSLLFYLLFFRDWNVVIRYHTIQCLLIFCNTYHRQRSECFTEASRLSFKISLFGCNVARALLLSIFGHKIGVLNFKEKSCKLHASRSCAGKEKGEHKLTRHVKKGQFNTSNWTLGN